MANVIDIEGIGEKYSKKLHAAGVATTEALLKKGATVKGRQALSDKTGIGHKLILKWVNRADLFRVTGIGEQYSDLLAAAGVDTVLELAQRRPDHLHDKLVEINRTHKHRLVRALPEQKHVADWIRRAKTLPRVVTY
jgi:predicted flap endonuclease-1-like 5' DNA nuclease